MPFDHGASAGCLVLLALGSVTQANVVIETVPVGNPGNAGELSGWGSGGYGLDVIVGGVSYSYNMGKYETTAGQYVQFLNAVAASDPYGLYNPSMDEDFFGCQITRHGTSGNYTYDFSGRPSGTEADWADRPVNYVSWADSVRFANWLHNGQGAGDTETGSYNVNGAVTWTELIPVTRQAGATWVIPTEDEWYKSAFHKNDGVTSNYFDYATGTDSVPSNDLDGGGNNATFLDDVSGFTIGGPYYRTEVGAHVNSESPYGTFDQSGNMGEWNETLVLGANRGARGGTFYSHYYTLAATNRTYGDPTIENFNTGFRIAAVPEPSSLGLLSLGALVLFRKWCS